MGFPVRVMEMSDKKRLPDTLWAALVADRAAESEGTIFTVEILANSDAGPLN